MPQYREIQLSKEEAEAKLEELRNSYLMYESSKAKTIEKRKSSKNFDEKSLKDTITLMETMQKDILDKYHGLGGKDEDLIPKTAKKRRKKDTATSTKNEITNYLKNVNEKVTEKEVSSSFNIDSQINKDYNSFSEKVSYDTINLPSKGQCYKNRQNTVMVSHLCAYDENMIMSPNLYKNGTFLDHLLKNKVLDDIDTDDLVQGDRDAIIIWLRASGYGNKYEVDVNDPETHTTFRGYVDLSKLKFKDFTLKGDENGYFDFKLPESGAELKFKFLTNKDSKKLEEMHKNDNKEIKINTFNAIIGQLKDFIDNNDDITQANYDSINRKIAEIESEMKPIIEESPETYFTHDITNRLILSTVSVNGNTDYEYISNFIINMSIKDASAYRRYIIDNEPGIDYNVEIERPSSLGGGYVKSFLQLDQFIFISAVQ